MHLLLLFTLIFALVFISFFVSFGLVKIILPNQFQKYVPSLALITLPLLLVVSLSSFGYSSLEFINLINYRIIFCIGLFLSLLVSVSEYKVLSKLIFSAYFIVPLSSGLISILGFCYLNSSEPYSFNYLHNGEFFNYAKLANMAIDKSIFASGFFNNHQKMRYGQDIFLGVIALLFKKNAIQVIHIGAGYLIFSYYVISNLIIFSIFGQKKTTYILLLINIFNLLPLFNCNTSFFSSAVTLPFFLLLFSFLCVNIRREEFCWLFLANMLFILFSLNVFFATTYPEFFVPIILALILFMIFYYLSYRQINLNIKIIFLGIIFSSIINPYIFLRVFKIFVSQFGTSAGWDILNNPINNYIVYLLNCLGIRYPTTKMHFYENNILSLLVIVFLIVSLLLGFLKNLKYSENKLKILLIVWIFFMVVLNIMPILRHSNWYITNKFFCQFSLPIVLLYGMGYNNSVRNRVLNLSLLFVILIIYFSSYFYDLTYAKKENKNFNFQNIKESLINSIKIPLLVINDSLGEVSWIADLLTDDKSGLFLSSNYNQQLRITRGSPEPDDIRLKSRLSCLEKNQQLNLDISYLPLNYNHFYVLSPKNEPINNSIPVENEFELALFKNYKIRNFGDYLLYDVKLLQPREIFNIKNKFFFDGSWSLCFPGFIKNIKIKILISHLTSKMKLVLYLGNTIQEIEILEPGEKILNISNINNESFLKLVSQTDLEDKNLVIKKIII